jgi:alanine racemase
MNQFYRQTWIEINLDAIAENITSFSRHLNDKKEIMAVVKADAYGHGAVPVAREAVAAGATWLGVALLEEAIELRHAGIEVPILHLGFLTEQYFSIAQEYNVSITVGDKVTFQYALDYKRQTEDNLNNSEKIEPLKFHLKLDTGMGRLGLTKQEELVQVVQKYIEYLDVNEQPAVKWEGLCTHFATADESHQQYMEEQINKFETALQYIQKQGIQIPYIHLANSAGILRTSQIAYANLVRLGISMYGLYPSQTSREEMPFSLEPVLSLHSRCSLIKKVEGSRGISYGKTYITGQEEWIGTLPIGYADGWDRGLSNRAFVLINGKRMPIVGRICMDQMMVRLDREYDRGESATLIGRQNDEEITADEIASLLDTINYEITCKLAKRVPRLYYKGGTQIK